MKRKSTDHDINRITVYRCCMENSSYNVVECIDVACKIVPTMSVNDWKVKLIGL